MRDDAYAISPGVGDVLIMVDRMQMRADRHLIYNRHRRLGAHKETIRVPYAPLRQRSFFLAQYPK